jgi:hypothetical protein
MPPPQVDLQHLQRENARLASQVEGLEARRRADVEKIEASEKEIISLRLQIKELKAQVEWRQPAISASGDTRARDSADRVQRTGDEAGMDGANKVPEPLVVEKIIYVEKPVEKKYGDLYLKRSSEFVPLTNVTILSLTWLEA